MNKIVIIDKNKKLLLEQEWNNVISNQKLIETQAKEINGKQIQIIQLLQYESNCDVDFQDNGDIVFPNWTVYNILDD